MTLNKGNIIFREKMFETFVVAGILLYVSCNSSAQDYAKDYHPNIYKAEELLLLGKEAAALQIYESLLTKYERVFAKDLYNAILCGIDQNADSDLIYDWFKRLFVLGIDEAFLRSRILVKVKDVKLRQRIELHWSEFRRTREAQIDHTLRDELELLAKRDQKFRQRVGGYKTLKDSIRWADNKNIKYLSAIIRKHGFPTEQQGGLKKPDTRPDFYVVLHHYCQTLSTNKNYFECCDNVILAIEKAAIEGKMLPQTACAYINWSGLKSVGPVDFKLAGNQAGRENINSYRKVLGLLPVEEHEKKQSLIATSRKTDYIF